MKCYDSEKQASLNIKTESLTELYVCGHGRCDDFIGGHLQPEKKKEKQTVRAGNSSACCRWISVVFRRPLPGVPVVLCRMCSHICPRKWCQNIWEEQPQRDPSPKIENKRNVLFYSLLKLLPLSEPTSTAFNLFDGDQHPEAGLNPDHLHRSRWSQ